MLVRLGESIDEANFLKVQSLLRHLDDDPHPAMIECVPAFASLTIHYDPLRATFEELCWHVQSALDHLDPTSALAKRVVEIPVCYEGEFGADLEFVAQQHGLSIEEVIAIHSSVEYPVYMIGFVPGFPYLGGVPERIRTPRRATPRLRVPAGSVGLAGEQTGIYPFAIPGGWQLIGRTPRAMFRPLERPPSLLVAGDVVRFRPISQEEFRQQCEYE
jgi:inhibitor of KinA